MRVIATQQFKRQEETAQTLYRVGDVIENAGSAEWALRHGYGEKEGATKDRAAAPRNKAKAPARNKGAK